MQTEIEAKFLDIDKEDIRRKLKNIGAKLITKERLMRRKVFEHAINKQNDWIRVRDEGDKITLSYKILIDRTLHGTKEIVVEVSDFEKTCEILSKTGLKSTSYQETKRETWNYKNTEITIDTWPWIPAFLEIESPTEEEIKSAAAKLGFNWQDAEHGSVETVYMKHYNVSEEEVDDWEEITFIPTPDWLESKRKNSNS